MEKVEIIDELKSLKSGLEQMKNVINDIIDDVVNCIHDIDNGADDDADDADNLECIKKQAWFACRADGMSIEQFEAFCDDIGI